MTKPTPVTLVCNRIPIHVGGVMFHFRPDPAGPEAMVQKIKREITEAVADGIRKDRAKTIEPCKKSPA